MGKRLSPRDVRAIDALEQIYAALPRVACRKVCGDACGPILMTDLEARRLQRATHRKPRTLRIVQVDETRERCIYLDARGRCGAYDVRPLICRVWGTIKMLSCPHGCLPDRWLTDLEFVHVARAIEAIGGGRELRTVPEGLTPVEGGGFLSVPTVGIRPADVREREQELTRGLRAIFGGRIIAAVGDPRAPITHTDLDKDD